MDDEPLKKGFWQNPLVWLIIIVILAYLAFAGIGWYYQFRSADELSEAARLRWLADHNRISTPEELAARAQFLKQNTAESQLSPAERLAELERLRIGK